MDSDKLRLLNQAICMHKVVAFTYEQQIRIVEPFLTGRHRRTGRIHLRAWQIGGGSKSGKSPNWRLYEINKIKQLRITDDSFRGMRPGYNRDDEDMDQIYEHI